MVLKSTWAREEAPRPFQSSARESPQGLRWSADGSALWSRPRGGGDWSRWDPQTGKRLRRAIVPDDLAHAVLSNLQTRALVGQKRDGRPERRILGSSADARRAITAGYPGSIFVELRNAVDGSIVRPIENVVAPFAFSPDGRRVVGVALGKLAFVVLDADDATPLQEVPYTESIATLPDLTWGPNGVLLINAQAPGHNDERLICFSLDYGRMLWQVPGYFPTTSFDRDGQAVAAVAADGSVHVWNVETADVIRVIAAEERPRGPLLCGEPNVLAMVERLRAHPIAFHENDAVTALRAFAGGKKLAVTRASEALALISDAGDPLPLEPLPWRSPDEAECAAALRALRSAADYVNVQTVAADGAFAVFIVHRNARDIPDPDAGSVFQSDASLGLWDRAKASWRWETSEEPEGFLLSWLCGNGEFALSWDESGIFMRASGLPTSATLYDVATGKLRPPRPGDEPPTPPKWNARALATDRTRRWTLGAHDSGVVLWDNAANREARRIDLSSIEDAPTVATFLDERRFVLGTEHGRLMRFDIDPTW